MKLAQYTTSDMPGFLRYLIWASLGIAAWLSIWKSLKDSNALKFILSELTSNHGASVKDFAKRAAEDSTKALRLIVSEAKKRAKLAKEIREGKKRQIEIEAHLMSLDSKLARYIVHEANNSLQTSLLLEEEKTLLIQLAEKKRLESSN